VVKKKLLDYSKFDNIADSDDEAIVPASKQVTLPLGMPREQVSREDYCTVMKTLLANKDLPAVPIPDLEQMWGYYKYGGMDEQALLDQACEVLGQLPIRLGPVEWKANTYALTKKLETESREDEARMWCVVHMSRFPRDPDGYYNHGVLLNKLHDKVKFAASPMTRIPTLEDGVPASKLVPIAQYLEMFSKAAIDNYRKCLKVDPKQRAAYINLIGCLERNEPARWYEQVHEIATQAVKYRIWYNMWQRPPHFVESLPAKPVHDPQDFDLCRALEENYPTIRAEYDAYLQKLVNRKDWDDLDTTPGLGDVGSRDGALHDAGLTKSGKWQEVPLFTNCTLQRTYAEHFPETVKILTRHCSDATGLAYCGGGDTIFSVITPGTRLRPHCGPSNSRLTCHLGIHIPRTSEQGLIWRVVQHKAGWTEGKCICFDDSFEHEVVYEEQRRDEPYPGARVVLLVNFWHPDFAFKNDPAWRQKSDPTLGNADVESLPQTALMKKEGNR